MKHRGEQPWAGAGALSPQSGPGCGVLKKNVGDEAQDNTQRRRACSREDGGNQGRNHVETLMKRPEMVSSTAVQPDPRNGGSSRAGQAAAVVPVPSAYQSERGEAKCTQQRG